MPQRRCLKHVFPVWSPLSVCVPAAKDTVDISERIKANGQVLTCGRWQARSASPAMPNVAPGRVVAMEIHSRPRVCLHQRLIER